MQMTGGAMAGVVGSGGLGWCGIVARVMVSGMIPNRSRWQHKGLCLGRLRRADAKAQLDHRRLDLVARRGAGFQPQRQFFGHHGHVHIANPRQPFDRRANLDRARGAIHPGDDPFLRFAQEFICHFTPFHPGSPR